MKYFLLICAIFFTSLLSGNEPPFIFFHPPSGWLISHPSHFKEGVTIGFVQSERKIFTPAITLTSEKIPCDEKTYIEAIKKNHRSDSAKSLRELGLIQTKSGNAHLIQIDMKHTWGKIRILQAILVRDHTAYIQTASCLREDFLKIHQDLLSSFSSLSISKDLLSSLESKTGFEENLQKLTASWEKSLSSDRGRKEDLFQDSFFQKNQWAPFIEYITQNYRELGICWQTLAIQYVKDKLLSM